MVADGDLRDLMLQVQAAATRIQRLSDDHWHALDPACRAMDDDAWVGPAGRHFDSAVRSARVELRDQLATAVRSAQTRLTELHRGS